MLSLVYIAVLLAVAITSGEGFQSISSTAYYGYKYKCKFALGGGNTYQKIGNYKQKECLDRCMHKKRTDKAINGIGVYTDQSRGGCWCLKNMPNRNKYFMFKSCAIEADKSETIYTTSNAFKESGFKCEFRPGGGRTFKWIGNFKQAECLIRCLEKKKSDNAINGIGLYADQTKGGCWCLKNMPNRNHYVMFKSCVIQSDPKVGAKELAYLNNGHRFTCKFELGGGNTYQKVGNFKENECLKACVEKKKTDAAINGIGVYTDQTRAGCWCLKNMPNRNKYLMFKSCVIEDKGSLTTKAPTAPPTTASSISIGSICKRNFKKIGCYVRDWTKVPHLLVTDLDPTHKNFTTDMNWDDYNKGLHSIACRCLKIAVGHYKYFAIGFNGECVAGKDHEELEEMFRVTKEDKSGCINGNWEECDKGHHTECVGNIDYDFFYEVLA